ncbi:NYN domain-containing protein [Wenzhouxiangella sp. XN24]|uniref:NYN domain-containing protein n=1 Tax=Wenzhouxiangella sp. XN24 TaxID=2713569 RepID=UPI0013EE3CDA|nr:NYN domain-containing protein [Wenzhouxiangella sp. XN24]NGX16142.1 hypothetical protein [Wenzhouxiangella sp. XN24]
MDSDPRIAPEGVISALCDLVDQIDQNVLLRVVPYECIKGHRPIPKNLPVFKRNLQSLIRSSNGVDDSIRLILKLARTPEVRGVPILSTGFISQNFDLLGNWFGRGQFLAACWLDEREAIHELAYSTNDDWLAAPFSEELRELAAKELSVMWSGFQMRPEPEVAISKPVGPTKQSDEEGPSRQHQKMIAEVKTLEAQKRKLQKLVEKLQGRIDKQEADTIHHRQTAEAVRERSKQLDAEKDELTQRLEAMEAKLEKEKNLAIAEALASETREWLSHAREIETAKHETQARDLVGFARDLLARQKSDDRNYGNVEEIRDQIAQRLDLIQELEHAQATALRPLPQLGPTIAQLRDETEKLQDLIGWNSRNANPLVRELSLRINGAVSLDALSPVRSFIEQAGHLQLLSSGDKASVLRALNRKVDTLIDAYGVPPSDKGLDQPVKKTLLYRLEKTKCPWLILVDGHNLIRKVGDLIGNVVDGERAGEAREKLTEIVRRYFASTRAEVLLYFDGPHQSTEVLSPTMRVIYSGGKGRNRADNAMLEALEEHKQRRSQTRYIVITSDLDLATRAMETGADVVSSSSFHDMVLALRER